MPRTVSIHTFVCLTPDCEYSLGGVPDMPDGNMPDWLAGADDCDIFSTADRDVVVVEMSLILSDDDIVIVVSTVDVGLCKWLPLKGKTGIET